MTVALLSPLLSRVLTASTQADRCDHPMVELVEKDRIANASHHDRGVTVRVRQVYRRECVVCGQVGRLPVDKDGKLNPSGSLVERYMIPHEDIDKYAEGY